MCKEALKAFHIYTLAVRDAIGKRYKNFTIWQAGKKEKTNSISVYINDTISVDTRCAFNLRRVRA